MAQALKSSDTNVSLLLIVFPLCVSGTGHFHKSACPTRRRSVSKSWQSAKTLH